MEFAYCGYMSEYVSVRVENCNRYQAAVIARETEESLATLLARYTLD